MLTREECPACYGLGYELEAETPPDTDPETKE